MSRIWKLGFAPAFAASAAAAVLGVVASFWIVFSVSAQGLFDMEGLAVGKVGTFIVLRAVVPAFAAGIGLAVGLRTAAHRRDAPQIPVLALFVVSIAGSEVAAGVSSLALLGGLGLEEPVAPRTLLEAVSALGSFATFFAVVSFVRFTTVYGGEFRGGGSSPATLWRARLSRVLTGRWVWVILLLSFALAFQIAVGRQQTTPGAALLPVYAVLLACGANLWADLRSADKDLRMRGEWLVHGALAFVLGFILRDVTRGLLPNSPELWSLPSALGTLTAVAAVAFAVFWRGVAGPALVVRSGTLLGIVGALGLFLYAGLEEVLTSWVVGTLGLPERVGAFGAAGVVALLLGQVQARLRADGRLARLIAGTSDAAT